MTSTDANAMGSGIMAKNEFISFEAAAPTNELEAKDAARD